ncbi:MAG: hypothetical protein IT291_09700 [Deltaproteobacteria bacterium]|nr:hypothetical protein [Deltaproteobacteria bacterium]
MTGGVFTHIEYLLPWVCHIGWGQCQPPIVSRKKSGRSDGDRVRQQCVYSSRSHRQDDRAFQHFQTAKCQSQRGPGLDQSRVRSTIAREELNHRRQGTQSALAEVAIGVVVRGIEGVSAVNYRKCPAPPIVSKTSEIGEK